MYVAGLILFPIAEFAYYLRLIKLVFQARTHDKQMFLVSKKREDKRKQHLKDSLNDSKYFYELSKHYIIKISQWEKIKLFVSTVFNSKKLTNLIGNKTYVKLLEEGTRKIDKYTNIVKVIKMLKTTKFLQKNTNLDDETKTLMEHNDQMLINLISSNSESDSIEDIDDQDNTVLADNSNAHCVDGEEGAGHHHHEQTLSQKLRMKRSSTFKVKAKKESQMKKIMSMLTRKSRGKMTEKEAVKVISDWYHKIQKKKGVQNMMNNFKNELNLNLGS